MDITWMDTKINRNAPCPCGSGKKYKKCCGLKEMESTQKRLTVQRGLRIPGIVGVQKKLSESVFKIITDSQSSGSALSLLSGPVSGGPARTLDGSRELFEEEVLVEDKSLEATPDDLLPPPKVSLGEESENESAKPLTKPLS